MGFLGGGFLGGGASENKSKAYNTTTTTSEQTTTIHDIGLTGQNAVDLAGVINAGETDRTALFASSFDKVVQALGVGYNSLIGGAGLLTTNAQEIAHQASLDADALVAKARDEAAAIRASNADYVNTVTGSIQETASTAQNNAQALVNSARDTANQASAFVNENKTMVFGVLAVAVLIAGFAYYKRHG